MQLVESIKPLLKALSKGHTVIAGQTQYGKSTAAMTMFRSKIWPIASKPCHIFVDTKHDDNLVKFGTLCRDMGEFKFHVLNGTKHIIYRPPGSTEKREVLTEMINFVFDLKGDAPRHKGHKSRPFIFFIDEVQLYSHKNANHPGLERLSTTGLGKNILMVIMGQRFQNINAQALSQCNNKIAFYMNDQKSYLVNQGIGAFYEHAEWLRQHKYHFAYLIAGDDVLRLHTPLPLPKIGISIRDLM
jgi:hypothetical protein